MEVTDGPSQVTATRRPGAGFSYDLVKASVDRIVAGLADETAGTTSQPCGAPGWLRSERMLDTVRVTEANWHDAVTDVDRSRPDGGGLIADHAWDERSPAVIAGLVLGRHLPSKPARGPRRTVGFA